MDSYLHCRTVEYPVASGSFESRPVTAGVGLCTGALIMELAFDEIPSSDFAEEAIICYVDDTMILVVADDSHTAAARASFRTSGVLRRIAGLGLNVAEEKTEMILFRPKRVRFPENISVMIGDKRMSAGRSMKYLGVRLDS